MEEWYGVVTVVAVVGVILAVGWGAWEMVQEAFFVGRWPSPTVEERARSAPAPPSHVHTWELRSREEVAGQHVSIFRCDDCGAVERWVV